MKNPQIFLTPPDLGISFRLSKEYPMEYEFTTNNCLFDLIASDRTTVLKSLVNCLQISGSIPDASPVLSAVLARESVKGTGLARGVACPHARIPGITGIHVAVARLKNPVDFEASDGQPSKHIFLILTDKTSSPSTHIKTLSSIVKCYQSPEVLQKLTEAEDPKSYISLLQACHD